MQRETFDRLMPEILNYYGKELSPLILGIWWKSVAPLTDEDFVLGCEKTIEFEKFLPTPARIKELIREAKSSLRPEHQEFAAISPAPENLVTQEQWNQLRSQMKQLASSKRMKSLNSQLPE